MAPMLPHAFASAAISAGSIVRLGKSTLNLYKRWERSGLFVSINKQTIGGWVGGRCIHYHYLIMILSFSAHAVCPPLHPPLIPNRHIIKRRPLRPMINPVENLGMPKQTVLLLQHPVVLIRKVEEPRRNPLCLQNIKQADAVALRQPVVKRVVDDELRRGEVGNVVLWVPLAVRVRVPDVAGVVVADEPEFFGRPGAFGVGDTVVGHEAFEFVAQVVGLDPVCLDSN
jgi:hypothetical protein